jgi:hypothetical protein
MTAQKMVINTATLTESPLQYWIVVEATVISSGKTTAH